MTLTDYVNQGKKEEEDLPALKIALTQLFEDNIKKVPKKNDYSNQKQYRQLENKK